jgi:nicotinamide-nucleotide amidase
MRINLLLTGDELMSGDTVDSNSAMIARQLVPLGWKIRQKITLGDDLDDLVGAICALSRDADVLLMNGGLGPTVDDLTAEAVAKAVGVGLAEHPQAVAHLETWCAARGIALNAANRKQALLPAGCDVVANPVGSAVGFAVRIGQCRVICTPGVPRELQAMLAETILPELQAAFPGGERRIKRFALFGIGESALQQRISDTIPDWPDAVGLGFRAGFPQLELKLTTADERGTEQLAQLLPRLQPLIADYLIGEVPTGATGVSLSEQLVKLLTEQRRRVAFAESCTGGLIAAQLTSVAGSSQVFEGSFVTYSNGMKQAVLGVQADTLARHGAVSEPVAREMVAGALRISGADYAAAVSGIAGPGGGSEDKPVGTVWIAWGSADDVQAVRLFVPLGRAMFQQYVAAVVQDLIRRRLLGIEEAPAYFRDRRPR